MNNIDVVRIYLYTEDPFESSIIYILTKKKVGIKEIKNLKAFIDYSQKINVYENLEDYNPTKKRTAVLPVQSWLIRWQTWKLI